MKVYCVESFAAEFDYDGRHSVGVPCANYPLKTKTVYLHLVALDANRVRDLRPHASALNDHGRVAIDPHGPWWFQAGTNAQAEWPGIPQLRNRGADGVPTPLFEVSD